MAIASTLSAALEIYNNRYQTALANNSRREAERYANNWNQINSYYDIMSSSLAEGDVDRAEDAYNGIVAILVAEGIEVEAVSSFQTSVAISVVPSNIEVPTDLDGDNPSYENSNSDFIVYEYNLETSATWTFAVITETNVSATITDNTVSITDITDDEGLVVVRCSKFGFDSVDVSIPVRRNRQNLAPGGEPGTTDGLPEGVLNLYFTEARANAASDVVANTAARHSHTNKATLDLITDEGSGIIISDAERTKLSGIEDGATTDQTGAEIKLLYEAEPDTNAYDDAAVSKLAGIEDGAEVNVGEEYTTAEKSKLAGIEDGAEVNPDAAEVKSLYESNADTNAYTDTEKTDVGTLTDGSNADTLHVHATEAIEFSSPTTHVSSLQDVINHLWSIGAGTDGFNLTENGDGTVDITAGTALLRSTNTDDGELKSYLLSAVTNLTLVDNATNYILADYNAGTPIITSSDTIADVLADNTKAVIYVANRLGNELNILDLRGLNIDFIAKNNIKVYKTEGIVYSSGAMISDDGSMEFSITAGEFYVFNEIFNFSAFSSNPDTFEYVYGNLGVGFTRIPNQTAIDYLQWDNNGVLNALSNHYYANHYVYAVFNSPAHFKVVYGTAEYSTLSDAQIAPIPTDLPSDLDALSTAQLIGIIIVGEDYPTAFQDIRSPFTEIFTSTTPVNHNNLSGLQGGTVGEYNHLTDALLTKLEGLSGSSAPTLRYQADQFLNVDPSGTDYTVNEMAPVSLDDNNPALLVRAFDDTTEEGVGFVETIPADVTNIIFTFKSRAQTAPGGTAAAVPKLYRREIADNTAVGTWGSDEDFTAISFPTNENWQYDSETFTLAQWGLTVGNLYQFELTRDTGSVSDTLSGDWNLLELIITFS